MPAWKAIFHHLCPRCRLGKIFRASIFRFPKMYERCLSCNLRFEREEGYFLGAMYISYGLSLLSIGLLSVLFWSMTDWPLIKDVGWALILFLPFAPAMTLFARVLWIYLDQAIDPDRNS
jgi:uncharacterized protein (DUF983 family)